jgi:hypothetical protein
VPSTYRTLLGPALDALPPALRRFHDVTGEWRGSARFRITRGQGFLRNLAANLGGLPPAGDDVPVRLRIMAEGDGERWLRDFGGHRLESVQRARGGLLVESFGAVALGLRLVAEPPALRLEPVRAWLAGVPWPRALAPTGTGVEVGRDDGCAIVATAYAPLPGEIVRYEGLVTEDARRE